MGWGGQVRDDVSPEKIDVPATSWAVLGVLSFDSELSGYDVKQWADQSLAFFYWAPSQSQIYGELRRLESLGLAVSRVEQTHEAKSRRLYAITAFGRECIRSWAERIDPDPIVLKHPYILRLWAAHNGDLDRLREGLQSYRRRAILRAEEAAGHAAGSAREPRWRFPGLALEWSERFYRDEAARIDWLLEELEARP